MKKLLHFSLIIILWSFSIHAKSQVYTFITPDETSVFKYFVGASEPDPVWYMPDFDDSGWLSNSGIIGYGYWGFETVHIDLGASSVYMRYSFNVANKETIKVLDLAADYDDGYIAYLNGKEIVRVNIEKSLEFPAYNDLTNRSHASEFVRYSYMEPVLGYYLDSMLLDTCLLEGENILAIQILNDSVNGSDMVFAPYLFDITYNDYNYYDFESRYKRQIDLDSSHLPLVILNTDQNGIPVYPKNTRVTVSMGIIDNGAGNYNKPDDAFNNYSGLISIETRGQSSRDFPKRSFRFELIDELGTDTSISLLGMPKENDWILFGPFADKSQIRNKLTYDLGSKLGSYQPRSRFCELIMNGELLGLYCLTETIKRDSNRVNIAKLKEDEISGVEVTGGYIMKWDKNDNNQRSFQMVYPKNMTVEQNAYLSKFLKMSDSTLNCNNFRDPVNGFRKYVSDSSLVDYIIMNEMPKNADSYQFSTYFYKDRDDRDNRIKYGPLWDFDLGFGNTIFQQGERTYGWQYEYNRTLNITRFLQDVTLVEQLQDRWHELRDGIFRSDSIFAFMDTLLDYIEPAKDRNYRVWPVIDEWLFYPGYNVSTYEAEIAAMKAWMTARLTWIDDNIDLIYYPVVIYSEITENNIGTFRINLFPNPFSDRLTLSVEVENEASLQIEITNLLGQVQYNLKQNVYAGYSDIEIRDRAVSEMSKGVYIVRMFINNELINTQKIIKN